MKEKIKAFINNIIYDDSDEEDFIPAPPVREPEIVVPRLGRTFLREPLRARDPARLHE